MIAEHEWGLFGPSSSYPNSQSSSTPSNAPFSTCPCRLLRVLPKVEEGRERYRLAAHRRGLEEAQLEFLLGPWMHDNLQVCPNANRRERVDELDFARNCIKEFPAFGLGTNMQPLCMRLANNLLDRLDRNLALYGSRLVELDVSHNRLSTICADFFTHLPALQKLHLEDNRLVSLPESIGRAIQLQVLVLGNEHGGNLLADLPLSMASLKDLRMLHLACNRLKSIPKGIRLLDKLVEICLEHNQISTFPFVSWPCIRAVGLRGNALKGPLPDLSHLCLLEKLDLTDNQLTTVPHQLINLPNRTCTVLLAGNPCTSGPSVRENPRFYCRLLGGECIAYFRERACTIPSLLELCARLLLLPNDQPPLTRATLTPVSKNYLEARSNDDRCTNCPVRFVQPLGQIVRLINYRGHQDVPLCASVCSIKCLRLCRRISISENAQGELVLDPTCLSDLSYD